MAKHNYMLVDVFTDRMFGGNPLAVFPDATEVPERYFQNIANELNLSETTFVLPPRDAANDFQVRIFTPQHEMPMAGHPTLGTAFVLAREGRIPATEGETAVVFEEGVGPIPGTIRFNGGAPEFGTMGQPAPEFGPELEDRAACAEMLALAEGDLLPGAPCRMVSCGWPFLFVPLRSLEAVGRIKANAPAMETVLDRASARGMYAFSLETERPEAQVHGRMISRRAGGVEDPATGSAAGPLGCYLVSSGLAEAGAETAIVCEQGFEMGRPSILHITIGQSGGEISEVKVGGTAVAMGGGWFDLP